MSLFDQRAAACPQFSTDEASALVRERYGLDPAAITSLGSFQDQNFKLSTAGGRVFVLKIANSATAPAELELQGHALAHLATRDPAFPTPRTIPTLGGELITPAEQSGTVYLARLLTFVPGQMLAQATRAPGTALLAAIGGFAGALTRRLADFDYPAPAMPSQWDLRHAPAVVRAFLPHVALPEHRALIERFLARYEATALPRLARLRTSMIHGDITSYNLLVERDQAGALAIGGLVDFGDMMRSYTIGELAVAIAETALDGLRDPLALAAPMVAGFHQAVALDDDELAVLFDMVCMRRCVVAVSIAQQLSLEPGNAYVRALSAHDWPVLQQLHGIAPALALAVFRQACGREPHPSGAAVRGWLAERRGSFSPIVPSELLAGAAVLDLSIGAAGLHGGAWASPGGLRAAIAQQAGAQAGLGRYAEVRLPYAAPGPDEPCALHLGADLCVPAGTPVSAPLGGIVEQVSADEIILRHQPADAIMFFTRYARVRPAAQLVAGAAVAAGQPIARVATASPDLPLPAHVHLQIGCEPPGGALPGLGRASQRAAWLSLCPDPNLILGLAALVPPAQIDAGALLARRARVIHQSQEYYYRQPPPIVRGWRQYLYDDAGRAYLDAINNVAHVGHSHPRVVAAAARQMALLNTNSRFLYPSIVEYAERLVARLPEPLRVVFFVCTGSEANDLALRLARAYTGQHDVIVIDGEYHGNTSAVDEISTSLLDNPAAKHTRPWVHAVLRPNTYRGPYGASDPDCAAKYAAEVQLAAARVAAQGRSVAAFVSESLLGSSGGVALPPGYLAAAYAAVRAHGGVCIADEVQVGFGRMGTHFWAFETQGVVPEIVTLGKPIGNGHPLSAVVTTPAVAAAFRNTTSYFNTYAGNPVSCAVGMAVLDVIEQEGLQANALAVGAYLKAALHELAGRHEQLGAVYGQGLYLGAELVRDRAGKVPATAAAMRVAERMRELGVIVYPTGDDYNILKIKPPLVFARADADYFVAMLDRALGDE